MKPHKKRRKIPLWILLTLFTISYFFTERNLSSKILTGPKAPLGRRISLEKGWDRTYFDRILKRTTAIKKKEVKQKEEKVVPEPTATVTAFYTDTEPIIDGRLDEECWQKSQEAYPFLEYQLKGVAINQTRAYILWSKKNLLIGFILEEKSIGDIRAEVTSHDGSVWLDDCLEIFLDVEGKEENYFHFVLNTLEVKYDAEWKVQNGNIQHNAEWNPSWAGKTFISSSFWSAEIAIPLRELGTRRLREGTLWKANFNRERFADETEISAWSCTYGGFHNPKRFGTLVFRETGPSLKLLPLRSKTGQNTVSARLDNRWAPELKATVRISSDEGKVISETESEKKADELSLHYELNEPKLYNLVFTLLDKNSQDIYFRTDSLPVGVEESDFIKTWLICGPFPNPGGRKDGSHTENFTLDENGWLHGVGCMGWDTDFLKRAGGEESVTPSHGAKVQWTGERNKWKAYESKSSLIDFLKVSSTPKENIIAYAACYIYSKEENDYLIKLGSDDGYKLWVNHRLINSLHVHRGPEPDQNSHRVHFNTGLNLILLKVCQDIGGFGFYLRLTDLEGYTAKLPVTLKS